MADEHGEKHGGEEHGHEEGHGGGGHGGGGHGGGGHGGEHEEAGAPEWLISFADNVALMMGFFVILLAMNMGPKAKSEQAGKGTQAGGNEQMMEFVIAMRAAFNNPISMKSGVPEEQPFVQFMKAKAALKGDADEEGAPGPNKAVQNVDPAGESSGGIRVLFEDNSALVTPSNKGAVTGFADKHRDQRYIIEIRGHASPFERPRDNDGRMDLSYARAKAVAKLLVDSGLKREQIRIAACSDTSRLVARSSNHAEDRTNQRVQVIITKETLPEDAFSKAASAGKGEGE